MESGFRIFGDELDRAESYVDVTVSGTDKDGNIYLEDGAGESWKFSPREIADLHDEDLIVGQSSLPFETHPMWDVLDQIGTTRKNANVNNHADRHLRDSAKNVFKALMKA